MDNFYHQCPPQMEDQGRHLTDFRSTTVRDEYLKAKNNIYRDDDFRLYLQTNATDLMSSRNRYHLANNRCWVNDCVHKYPTRCNLHTMAKEKEVYDSMYDINTRKTLECHRRCKNLPHYSMFCGPYLK